jgi:hypothetical protein
MRVSGIRFFRARRQRQPALVGRTAAASAISGLDAAGRSDACMCASLNFLLPDFTAWAGCCHAADHHLDAPPG